MKSRVIICVLMMSFFQGFSQNYSHEPWMLNSKESSGNKKEYTIYELKSMFDEYWKTHDKKVKGSGYKPFMRWYEYWKNNTDKQGYIATPLHLSNAWKEKQLAKADKNSKSFKALPPSNWKPVGPSTVTFNEDRKGVGRVNIVHVDPSNPNTIYVGAPAGGIWKSADAGVNWTPLSDELPQIGVSGIAIDYTNSNIIYIATGDKEIGSTYSIGVLKSTDGGKTWNTTGLTFTNATARAGDIVIDPKNSKILWCATSEGLYKTVDAGTTWKKVIDGYFSKGNIRLKPIDSKTVLLSQ